MKTKFSIIFLFIILNISAFAQEIKILSSDAASIVVEYRPFYSDTLIIKSNGTQYYNFTIPLTRVFNLDQPGDAQKFVREINIGVPSETGNTIQIIAQDYSTLNGKLLPVPQLMRDSIANYNKYFESNNYGKSVFTDAVDFGEYGLTRDLRVQSINIYPVQFDGSNNSIRLLKRLVFKINYAPVNSANVQKLKEDFYKALVINWEAAQNWGFKEAKLQKVNSSVFSSGNWYKFETPDEGIYKIDRAFLQNLGIDVNSVDPRTIKIYGNGGYALPESINDSWSNMDIQENAIIVEGEADGRFDSGDYILFYGRPAEFWEHSSAMGAVVRVKNPYSAKNYYWLTYGGVNGKRMEAKSSLNVGSAYIQNSTFAYKSYDKDSVNIGKSGRDYFCDPLTNTYKSKTYINMLNGILPGSKINYKYRVVNSSKTNISYRVDESGTQLASATIAARGSYDYGIDSKGTASIPNNLSDERSVLKFTMNSGAPDAEMMLDYFEITYQKYLKAVGDNLIFYAKDTTAVISYTLNNFSNSSIKVFDVTDYENVKSISNASISGGQFTFQASENYDSGTKYIAITESQYKTPSNGTKVNVANLRGITTGSEMIIITSKELKAPAEKYAAYRSGQSPNKLTTTIVYVDDILNEFSGGLMDPTAIRDFLKYAYEHWETKPTYVLLFGDGSFDYLNTVKNNINIVPTYQSYSTYYPLFEMYSYPMDDYYSRIIGNDKNADLAVGRVCVQNVNEAEIAVDKIIEYETGEDKGDWRNRITLVADDGPAGGTDDYAIHTSQSEDLAIDIIPEYIDEQKIYLVAYPTVYVGVGRRKPDVNKAIIDAINNGTLVLNYVGHGAPKFWAHEYVFETAVAVPQMTNKNYFMLTAATCDFGRFDDPTSQSGTEDMLNKQGAGAISAFTATRVVGSTDNAALNTAFYTNLFKVHQMGGSSDRIGMAYMLTKQRRTNDNDERFILFGDPAVRLNLPKLPVSIDSLNGKSTTVQTQISALGTVKIKGTIKNENNVTAPVNGEAIVSVFDSKRYQSFPEMLNYTITLQGGLIYRGRVSVTNGEFSTEFVVPKDISYENQKGKIVVYFYNDNTDGVGTVSNFTVGGTNSSVVNDGKGPEIEIFFDNENFQDAYLVNPNFTLIAKLNDEVGINTTGTGIGHKLEGILNDDLNKTYDFTNYFVGDLNSGGKSGVVKYLFSSMEPGDYKIKVKAWDVFNNYSSQETYFTVVSADGGIAIRDVYNYPNPFASNTTFTFQHNISGAINVKIRIYTIAGRMIKEITQNDLMNKFVRIDWDGRDEDGNAIGNGTYLYKMTVESSDGKSKDSVLGKLAVIK
jgi:hypothetical protein